MAEIMVPSIFKLYNHKNTMYISSWRDITFHKAEIIVLLYANNVKRESK